MGKPITDEQKYKVISLWYQGHLRDEIAKITGIGKGSVSNILKEFKEKMKQGDFEAIQIHARLNREFKLDHEKMLEGHRTNQIMEKNQVNNEKLNSVIEDCGKVLKSGLDLSSLLEAAVEVADTKKRTGQSIDEVKETYHHESSEVVRLKNEKNSLQQDIRNARQQKQVALADANTTQEIINEFVKACNILTKKGLSIWDLIKSPNVIQEFVNLGFDAKKIILYFQKLQGLIKVVNSFETKKQNLEKEILYKQTQLLQVTKDLDALTAKYKKYSKSIKIIQKFLDSNQDPQTIVDWKKTLKTAGVDVATFDSKLKEHHGIVQFLQTLKEETRHLQTQKEQLLTDINSSAKRLQELQNDEKILNKRIEQQLARVSEQISRYEDSNPLWIIRDSNCDPVKANQIIVIFFKVLKKYVENKTSNSPDTQTNLDLLINFFEREGNSHSK